MWPYDWAERLFVAWVAMWIGCGVRNRNLAERLQSECNANAKRPHSGGFDA